MTKNELADALADCLDSIERGEHTVEECLGLYPEHREELASLLGTASSVRERAGFSPRPGFCLTSRQRLLERLEPHQHPLKRWFLRRARKNAGPVFLPRLAPLWAIILVLLVSLIGGGTVHASSSALPGDGLYPLKLSVEDARLFLADDAGDVSLTIQFAQNRAEELQALLEAEREEDLDLAVNLFSDQVTAATDSLTVLAQTNPDRAAQLGSQLDQTLSTHTEKLNSLLTKVPDAAKSAIEHAILASSRGQGAVHDLIGDVPPADHPGGGPPDGIPAPDKTPPAGGPPDGVPGHGGTPPGQGRPRDGTYGPPTWVPGGKP
jgi:hypothetical protein